MPHAGATVLVRTKPTAAADTATTRYRPGMVSDANNGGEPQATTYDVIYDEADERQKGEEDEDEEDIVSAERVLGVPASPSTWCAARLNLARCSFRGGRHNEVRGRERPGKGRWVFVMGLRGVSLPGVSLL